MNQRKKFLLGCVAALLMAGAIGLSVPFIGSWGINARATDAHLSYIDLENIIEDQALKVDWRGYEVIIVKPRQEVLDQLERLHVVKKWGDQPPGAESRLNSHIKVFSIPKHNGMVQLSEVHYWRPVIPCSKFEYLPEGYASEHNDLWGALKCTSSNWTFWEEKMVFDLSGRSQSPEVANLDVPEYGITEKQLILGADR